MLRPGHYAIANGKAARPGIGISAAPEEVAARVAVEGIVIIDVLPQGGAADAGLRGIDRASRTLGDVITHVDGRPVHTIAELAAELERIGIGNSVELTILRDGRLEMVTVTVSDIS